MTGVSIATYNVFTGTCKNRLRTAFARTHGNTPKRTCENKKIHRFDTITKLYKGDLKS